MNKPENKQTPEPAPGKHSGGGFGGPRSKDAKAEKKRKAEEAAAATKKLAEDQAAQSDADHDNSPS